MKLSEYFQQQKSQVMTSQMKSQLFSRIQKEKFIGTEVSTKLPSKIFFFASRKIMYASLASVLILVVFGGLLLDRNDVVDFGLFSVEKHTNPGGVFADYVAEIIEFNGDYSLVRDGLTVSNLQDLKLIEDGDIVTLPEGTDLIFTLTDGTQAKIIGPAEFSIKKGKKGYEISLVDGKFFRIYCPECVSEIDVVTPDLSIHQDKNQVLDVHIAKEDNGEMLVKNDGDDVTVVTKKDTDKKETKLTSTEIVSLNQDTETIDILEDVDLMSAFMAKNNISATFTLSTEKVDWPTIEQKPSGELLAMQTGSENTGAATKTESVSQTTTVQAQPDPLLEGIREVISSDLVITGDIDESISAQLGITSDEQQVPNPDQMQSLRTNLNSFFLMNLFESIYNGDKVEQNIGKFAERINSLATSFGYSDRASASLSNIKEVTLTLKSKLEKDWYISPSYILQLEKIGRWCDELANPTQEDWESLKSDLPINLRLM